VLHTPPASHIHSKPAAAPACVQRRIGSRPALSLHWAAGGRACSATVPWATRYAHHRPMPCPPPPTPSSLRATPHGLAISPCFALRSRRGGTGALGSAPREAPPHAAPTPRHTPHSKPAAPHPPNLTYLGWRIATVRSAQRTVRASGPYRTARRFRLWQPPPRSQRNLSTPPADPALFWAPACLRVASAGVRRARPAPRRPRSSRHSTNSICSFARCSTRLVARQGSPLLGCSRLRTPRRSAPSALGRGRARTRARPSYRQRAPCRPLRRRQVCLWALPPLGSTP